MTVYDWGLRLCRLLVVIPLVIWLFLKRYFLTIRTREALRQWELYRRCVVYNYPIKGWTEIKDRFFETWKATKIAILFFLIRLVLLCVVCVVLFFITYSTISNILLSIFTTRVHKFSVGKNSMAKWQEMKMVPHVVRCPCQTVSISDLRSGILWDKARSTNYMLWNVMDFQECVIRNDIRFIIPKLWAPMEIADEKEIVQSEFNPCILTFIDRRGAIKHLFNPTIRFERDQQSTSRFKEKSHSFPFLGSFTTERHPNITVRYIEPFHGDVKHEKFTGNVAVLLQHAIDILNGEWVKTMSEMNVVEEKTTPPKTQKKENTSETKKKDSEVEVRYENGKKTIINSVYPYKRDEL